MVAIKWKLLLDKIDAKKRNILKTIALNCLFESKQVLFKIKTKRNYGRKEAGKQQ